MSIDLVKNTDFKQWFVELKERIRQSQIKAMIKVNSELLRLYWDLGQDIVIRQMDTAWGSGFYESLSRELKAEFPDIKGFSKSNLYYLKQFYLFYSQSEEILHQVGGKLGSNSPQLSENLQNTDKENITIFHQAGGKLQNDNLPEPEEKPHAAKKKKKKTHHKIIENSETSKNQDVVIFHQAGGKFEEHPIFQIPWRHHIEIFTKCKSVPEALFYIQKTIKNGWSRAVLMNFIETGLYQSQGKAVNNFDRLLPEVHSDLAKDILKDPYNFDFLTLTENFKEKELEDALVENITKFLLELGQGFAYVGRQYPIQVGSKSRNIDLLFYHLELRCYVVIELKIKEFEPEHTGKLGYYMTAINHQLKKEIDNPTIGLLICRTKDNIDAQYSLESSSQPIGISEYAFSKLLPENFKSSLPSIEEIERELSQDINE